jgi:hypothetical protein
MDVQYVPRGEGWRGRGRPPRRVPAELMDMLRHTYRQGDQAVIPTAGHPQQEIDEVCALLRRGAIDLGLRLRLQTSETAILFYVKDFSDE